MLKVRKKIGDIAMGCAAITPTFELQAKYVIHTVGSVWDGGSYGEEALLRNCYDNSLRLALKHKCKSIAFPLISTGDYGFPKDKALQIAISAFSKFLMEHDMQIYLVVFDHKAYKLSENLFQGVAAYIDQHYVDVWESTTYGAEKIRRNRRRRDRDLYEKSTVVPCASEIYDQENFAGDLDAFLKQKDAGFVETLLDLIQKSGQKNSTIYKKANISKQHFSKLINDPTATITKPVAVAFALALELDINHAKDLIGRAGYTLSNGNLFDLIILYHIENKKFNIVEINIALYEFDQTLLGN